jgi:hypothetical protein
VCGVFFIFLVLSSTAICLCEQTFNEASAAPEEFCDAFVTALYVYVGSTLESTVNEKIRALPWEDYKDWSFPNSKLHGSMIEIIMSHPLRTNLSERFTELCCSCSSGFNASA